MLRASKGRAPGTGARWKRLCVARCVSDGLIFVRNNYLYVGQMACFQICMSCFFLGKRHPLRFANHLVLEEEVFFVTETVCTHGSAKIKVLLLFHRKMSSPIDGHKEASLFVLVCQGI